MFVNRQRVRLVQVKCCLQSPESVPAGDADARRVSAQRDERHGRNIDEKIHSN